MSRQRHSKRDRRGRVASALLGSAGGAALALTFVPSLQAKPRVRRVHASHELGPAAVDASAMPRRRDPAVVRAPTVRAPKKADIVEGLVGATMATLDAPFADRRRRVPITQRPAPFGDTLQIGERFRFDVKVSGNPAGLAEAAVVSIDPDPRGRPPGGAPTVTLQGHARTSGIVSLLATVTDDVTTVVDARTGAAISSENILHYDGWSPVKYKHRVTDAKYEGRGYVRIVDTKDGKAKTKIKQVPVDTFDAMAAMAWVRSLDLKYGERAKAHAIDGTTLLRVEVESKGRGAPKDMPPIAAALGLGREDLLQLHGVLTRVDEYDQPIPGKRVYEMRAFISADARRIPLILESDMWVGSLRLELTSYDPPMQARPDRSTGTSAP